MFSTFAASRYILKDFFHFSERCANEDAWIFSKWGEIRLIQYEFFQTSLIWKLFLCECSILLWSTGRNWILIINSELFLRCLHCFFQCGEIWHTLQISPNLFIWKLFLCQWPDFLWPIGSYGVLILNSESHVSIFFFPTFVFCLVRITVLYFLLP